MREHEERCTSDVLTFSSASYAKRRWIGRYRYDNKSLPPAEVFSYSAHRVSGQPRLRIRTEMKSWNFLFSRFSFSYVASACS